VIGATTGFVHRVNRGRLRPVIAIILIARYNGSSRRSGWSARHRHAA